MSWSSRQAVVGAVLVGLSALAPLEASATAPAVLQAGRYTGRTSPDASGKPRAISFTLKKTGCGTAAYCIAVDPESFLEGKCATSGYMYDAFFPIRTPIALPASGRIDHTYTLYVANGEIRLAPGGGAVPSGKLHLSLAFDGPRAAGTEHLIVDLREGDGVCDTGPVDITASR
jgi:hypothetical protein